MRELNRCGIKCLLNLGKDVLSDHTQPCYSYTYIFIAAALVQTLLTRSFLILIHSHSQRSLELALGGLSMPLPALHPTTPSIQSKHSNPELLHQIKPGLSLFFTFSVHFFLVLFIFGDIPENISNDRIQ